MVDILTVWKTMIINYLERYFYIICFATYVRQNANAGFEKTFVNWLDEHKVLSNERLCWIKSSCYVT